MVVLDRFPENRYAALNELQSLSGFRRFELVSFFHALSKADDCFIRFNLGDLSITFMINSGLYGDKRRNNKNGFMTRGSQRAHIRILFELEKENVDRSATYRFNAEELEVFNRTMQLRIESFGGD